MAEATLLVYSDDPAIRETVRLALGKRLTRDIELRYVEAATGAEVVAACDAGGIDLAVLDGEAQPTGGMGLCRQLRAELEQAPPVVLLTGRRDDAWLATWSGAAAAVPHPIDAVRLGAAALEVLRAHLPAVSG